ncbi:alpha/beta hydrolase [Myxococcus stipitatus]|uniref:alpha/beta fold hydrolase n=1 Tax=Myxococcus stipitatus TaxID=83455 RepID=UPI001F1BDF0A|nr:alpha/beta hydrolase [Myxococcus stipitatus]MCE9671607.1 alpha/beta hydrolase [Myxococcus stipitatus]
MVHKGKLLTGLGLVGTIAFALGFRKDRPAREVEARRAPAPPSRFIDVNGVRTHYRDQGQGPVIVLLHGSNASLHTWNGWVEALSPHYRVITADVPGQGATGPDPMHRYRFEDEVAWLDAFVRQLGLERFTLGGNSMGGGISWRYTLLHPEKVERLILVSAYGLPRDEHLPIYLRFYAVPGLRRVVRWYAPRFMVRRAVEATYGDPRRVTQAKVDLYEDILLREGNREATWRRFAAHEDDDMEQRLGEIQVPTLILWGSDDTWILPKYAEKFHSAIPDTRLVIFDGLGHVLMEEDPAKTVAVVQEFLRDTEPAHAGRPTTAYADLHREG